MTTVAQREGENYQLVLPFFMSGKRHLACGGRLVYSRLKGGVGYKCESCGIEYMKRGYRVPFPKGTKTGAEVAKGIPFDTLLGQTFLLMSYIETSDPDDEIRPVLMYCKAEDGSEIKIGTTSDVVRKQLKVLDYQMPVLITPEKRGKYYVIY